MPEVIENNDHVVVIVERRLIRPEIIDLVHRIDQRYELTQRERICLGMVAQHESLTALEFSRLLALDEGPRLRGWIGRLLEKEVILSRGRTRATEYRINPAILRSTNFKGKTTLKAIAPHRVKELILADISRHGPSAESPVKRGEIHARIGREISPYKVRKALEDLQQEGKIASTGKRGQGGGYYLSETPPNK